MIKLRKIYKKYSAIYLNIKLKPDIDSISPASDKFEKITKAYFESFKNFSFLIYKIKSVLFVLDGSVQISDDYISAPNSNEVIIKTKTSIISPGTEKAQLNKLPNAKIVYPHNPGYCGSGVILKASRKTGFKVNDRVCGLIPHSQIAKLDKKDVFLIPSKFSFTEAAFFPLFLIVARSIEKINSFDKKKVVIVGQGIIGLILLQVIKSKIPREIIVITATDKNHLISKKNGADKCLSIDKDNHNFKNINADLVFDVTPDPLTLNLAIEICAEKSKIILLGSSRGLTKNVNLDKFLKKNITVEGAHARIGLIKSNKRKFYLRQFFKHILDKIINIDLLLSTEVSPNELPVLYEDLSKGKIRSNWIAIDWDKANNKIIRKSIFRYLNFDLNGISSSHPKIIDNKYFNFENEQSNTKINNTNIINYGLIGCGEIGLSNSKAVDASKNSVLKSVCDTDTELAREISEKFNCNYTSNYKDLLYDKEIDTLLICTPHHLHVPIALEALNNNKNIIIEKPLANTLSQARNLFEVAMHSKNKVTISFLYRYDPQIQFFKNFISSGYIGNIQSIDFSLLLNKPDSYWSMGNLARSSSDWRKSKIKSGGGIIAMQLSHHFDIIRFITGLEIQNVSTKLFYNKEMEVESAANINFNLSNGAIGTIKASYNSTAFQEKKLEITGTKGQLEVYNSIFFTKASIKNLIPNIYYKVINFPTAQLRRELVDDFSQSIQRNTTTKVTLEDGLKSQELIESCYNNE